MYCSYIEGIVRGYRNALLTNQNYGNLTQCENIDGKSGDFLIAQQLTTVDVKLQLGPAYGDFLASLPPNPSTSSLAAKLTDKLVADFRYIQGQATGTLAKFMDYLTYGYMIDNVALLITGTLHERDTRELLERCHPLGWFETMPVLCVATNIEELYNSVLIETPLAPYFKGSLSHQDLDELNIEIVRNTLYKNYLEDFHHFVNSHSELKGTPTAETMSEILDFEADRRAINITLNSFGTDLSKGERKKLYPEFGKLYPEGSLMLSRADDIEGVALAVSGNSDYKAFFDQVGLNQGGGGAGNMAGGSGAESKSLEDLFYQKEMELSKLVFTKQFTHAVIYGWVKLREQVWTSPTPNLSIRMLMFFLGDTEHHMDCRVHRTKPEGEDRELHQCLLITFSALDSSSCSFDFDSSSAFVQQNVFSRNRIDMHHKGLDDNSVSVLFHFGRISGSVNLVQRSRFLSRNVLQLHLPALNSNPIPGLFGTNFNTILNLLG